MVGKLPYLPDEHHYAIAAVATRSAQMDHHIEHFISFALLEYQETARFLLKRLDGNRLVELLKAVLLDNLPTQKEDIDKLISDIGRLRAERNEILHWLWGASEDPMKAIKVTIRPYRDEQRKEHTAAEIAQIADEMLAVCVRLLNFEKLMITRPSGEQTPLRETHAPQSLHDDSPSPLGMGLLNLPLEQDPEPKPSQG